MRNPAWARAALCLLLLPGCAYNASIHGLRPVSPPQRMGAMMSDSNPGLEYPVVASSRPVLEWEAFVPPQGPTANNTAPRHITYDLRIWETSQGSPAYLVYERIALPSPIHQVEHRLRYGTRYFWSVRARFEINGETRLTDWSRSLHPYRPFASADRPGEIPASNYFRFATPGSHTTSGLSRWDEFFAEKIDM